MMADYRLQITTTDLEAASDSKFEQAQIYMLKENRPDLALKIFEDLYLGSHPLAELC